MRTNKYTQTHTQTEIEQHFAFGQWNANREAEMNKNFKSHLTCNQAHRNEINKFPHKSY